MTELFTQYAIRQYREGDGDLKHGYEEATDQILHKMGNILAQQAPQAQIASQLEALTQEYAARRRADRLSAHLASF